MSWFNKHRMVWRVVALMIFIIAILGPWTYSADGVPPSESCHEPYILVSSNSCVRLMPGVEIIAFLGMMIGSLPGWIFSEAVSLTDLAREFLFIVLISLILLPFLGTLILILNRESRKLRILEAAMWGAAIIPALLLVLDGQSSGSLTLSQAWGIWLYLGLAVSMLVYEVAGMRISSKPEQL